MTVKQLLYSIYIMCVILLVVFWLACMPQVRMAPDSTVTVRKYRVAAGTAVKRLQLSAIDRVALAMLSSKLNINR